VGHSPPGASPGHPDAPRAGPWGGRGPSELFCSWQQLSQVAQLQVEDAESSLPRGQSGGVLVLRMCGWMSTPWGTAGK
jgi:hypothetical protein